MTVKELKEALEKAWDDSVDVAVNVDGDSRPVFDVIWQYAQYGEPVVLECVDPNSEVW